MNRPFDELRAAIDADPERRKRVDDLHGHMLADIARSQPRYTGWLRSVKSLWPELPRLSDAEMQARIEREFARAREG